MRHKLTGNRARWPLFALLFGVAVVVWAWLPLDLSAGTVLLAILGQMAAGITLAFGMARVPDQPGRAAARTLAWEMAALPWLLLPLAFALPYPRPRGWLMSASALAPLMLLVLLVRMRQWAAVWLGLIGLIGALVGTCTWLRLLDALE